MWSVRHDGLQRGAQTALQFSQTTVLPIRGQHWFGSAGCVASSARPGSYRRGDLILPHYRATGSHVIVDVAVGDPCGSVALAAGGASVDVPWYDVGEPVGRMLSGLASQ